MNTASMTALALLPPALFTLISCSSTSQPPPPVGSARLTYTQGVPGGVLVQTVTLTATVTAMDPDRRTVTLQGPGARKSIVQVRPAAVSFDQLRVGDRVTATVTQKVVVSLDDPEAARSEGSPITATVIAINSANRTANLRFEDGATEVLHVRDDVDLSRHKVGGQVVFRVIEMAASRIEKAQ
jgi:hypothetical protein